MVAWDRWAGEQIGKKYSIDKLIAADGNHASFLASSPQSPSEPIVVTFFPADEERNGWPGCVLHLRHPHLRLILGAGEERIQDGEWRCIAVERADFLLSERLDKEGPLPTPLARQLTAHLIEGLHYLHGKNLVYRNLKPETVANIGGVWKLADFTSLRPAGVADPKQTRAFLTSSPQVPPDAYTGLISPAWDIYSLGVTLNQCLLGDQTERGAHLRLPDPFESIVRGCLEPRPEDRISLEDTARLLGLNSLNGQPLTGNRREPDFSSRQTVAISSHIPLVKPAPRAQQQKRRREWRWLGALSFILICEALALSFLTAARPRAVSPPIPAPAAIPDPAATPAPQPAVQPPPPAKPAAGLEPGVAKRQINAFLKHWISTVQERNLEAHVDCYAAVVEPFFRAARADRRQVRREKQRVFNRIGKVRKVTIDKLTYESVAADRAVVSLRKEWDIAGPYPSSGVENERLTLARVDGEWKIAGEEENNIRWVRR